jgi:hypothetical protein
MTEKIMNDMKGMGADENDSWGIYLRSWIKQPRAVEF